MDAKVLKISVKKILCLENLKLKDTKIQILLV